MQDAAAAAEEAAEEEVAAARPNKRARKGRKGKAQEAAARQDENVDPAVKAAEHKSGTQAH